MARDAGESRSRRWPVAGILLCLGGLALFGALALASRSFESRTEQRLLTQQTEQAGAVIALAIDQQRSPLASAALTAGATDGSPEVFAALMGSMVGEDGRYARAALLRVGSADPIAVVGEGPLLIDEQRLTSLVTGAPEAFRVVDLLAAGRALGYAVHDDGAPEWLVYAETLLNPDPTVRQRTDRPFNELNYAMYLATSEAPEDLMSASTDDLPLDGRRSVVDVPFGDQNLRLVTTARGPLGNDDLLALWWVVLAGGVLATAAVAVLLENVLASRRRAHELVGLTETLYNEQRGEAEALQRMLLPVIVEPPAGTQLAARYWPAGTARLIGGDFYDAFPIDDRRWAVLIGDICGKGIEAASLTGLARYTVRAASRYCTSPSEMLAAVHIALRQQDASTFCTACLIVVEPGPAGISRARISLAGHPPPLVRSIDGKVTEVGKLGPILGWFEPELHDTDLEFCPGDVVVLYTDGLTDAPGEQGVPIAEVEELLRERGGSTPVDQLADDIRALKRRRRPHGSSDDTALLCIRFLGPSATDSTE